MGVVGACSDDGDDTTMFPVVAGGAGGAPGAGAPAPVMCPIGQSWCTAYCADLQNDPRNCGLCGTTCVSGLCGGGQCVCPTDLTTCPTGCVDVQSDELNCGLCGKACAAGEVCQQGQCLPPGAVCTPACVNGQVCRDNACECPAPTTFCGGACVDTSTTVAHCGKCDEACGGGQLCEGGKCVCPDGQTLCDDECADLQLSSTHCGMCGMACADGEACMAGSCHAPIGADGCDGAPRDLAIQEVAAFQTVKVPLSRGVTLIDPDTRTSLVQNRPTLFRVYVRPGTGFSSREFSARVTLENENGVDQYYAKQRISGASSEGDTASTFQISVPRERIQANTRYSVELVDCAGGAAPGTTAPPAAGSGATAGSGGTGGAGGTTAPGSGGAAGTRVPADGSTELSAVDTGTLKIRFVPLVAGGFMPDTSDAVLDVYRAYLEAMYPVDEVELIVAEPLSVSTPVSWNRILDQLRSKRQQDQVPADEYYYGLLRPTETFQQFCRGGCTAGVSYIGNTRQTGTRVGLGLAYGDEMASGIMAHELGHSHGRPHAPCAPGGIQSVDPAYPYDGASTGVWAYDVRSMKFLDPAKTKDIMSYCDPKWISDYTYDALLARSSALNDKMRWLDDPDTVLAYRVLLLDADGVEWREPFPRPEAPYGTPEDADVLDAGGRIVARVTVYRTTIADSYGFTILVPPPQPGWHAVQLRDTPPLAFSAQGIPAR